MSGDELSVAINQANSQEDWGDVNRPKRRSITKIDAAAILSGWVSAEEHDRRVKELHEANNRGLERARKAERKLHAIYAALPRPGDDLFVVRARMLEILSDS